MTELLTALRTARAVVVVTGAGVSAESGIPTFRDAMEGLWAKEDPQQLATPEGFAADPETVTRWYDWRRQKCLAAQPNAGHRALADLQRWVTGQNRSFTLVTQNVDRLHQAAGSVDVIELHGSILVWRCARCGVEREELGGPFSAFPPRCDCGGLRRPAVVWFGEALPESEFKRAHRAARECDFLFSIGTSAQVYPAASLAQTAHARGSRVAEINAQPTPLSEEADWSLIGKAGEILPGLVARAREAG